MEVIDAIIRVYVSQFEIISAYTLLSLLDVQCLDTKLHRHEVYGTEIPDNNIGLPAKCTVFHDCRVFRTEKCRQE